MKAFIFKREDLIGYGCPGQWHFWIVDCSFVTMRLTQQGRGVCLQVFIKKPFLRSFYFQLTNTPGGAK